MVRLRLRLRLASRRRGGPPARLTGMGAGVASVAGTLAVAVVDRVLFGGLGVLFGLGYLVVCFQVAVRVGATDLPAAPISGPIAFAFSLVMLDPVSGNGVAAQLLALAGALAVRAGWLFTGTGVATAIVAARFIALRRVRR